MATKKPKYTKIPDDFEGNFEALMSGDWDQYQTEAKRLRAIGIERVGIIGAVCPKCFRQCRNEASAIYPRKTWCHCPEAPIVTGDEIVAALGFPQVRAIKADRDCVV